MNPSWILQATMTAALTVGAASAQAALIEREGGLAYYDDVLDITWLADANLAASNNFGVSGIASNGTMLWSTANAWIGALNTANYLGVNTWRLPTLSPVNGVEFQYMDSYDGSTDAGFNFTGAQSEMAYNFYTNLDGTAQFTTSGMFNFPWGLLEGTGPFSDIGTERAYWSGLPASPTAAWVFSYASGNQGFLPTDPAYADFNNSYAWAVASGDVFSPVPLPAAAWLLGSGVLGLLGFVRRRVG